MVSDQWAEITVTVTAAYADGTVEQTTKTHNIQYTAGQTIYLSLGDFTVSVVMKDFPASYFIDDFSVWYSKLTVWFSDDEISVENANRLGIATFWLTAEIGEPIFQGLNDFSIVTPAAIDDNGLWRVTLVCFPGECGNGDGFTSPDEAGIAAIYGASGVEVVAALLSSYGADGTAVEFTYGFGENDTPVVSAEYDLNGDNVIDQFDLVMALRYYTVNSNDTYYWDEAKIADFNGDGEIGIPDFRLLLQNMAW